MFPVFGVEPARWAETSRECRERGDRALRQQAVEMLADRKAERDDGDLRLGEIARERVDDRWMNAREQPRLVGGEGDERALHRREDRLDLDGTSIRERDAPTPLERRSDVPLEIVEAKRMHGRSMRSGHGRDLLPLRIEREKDLASLRCVGAKRNELSRRKRDRSDRSQRAW